MIKELSLADRTIIFNIINESAIAYKGVIPPDMWKEPYMPQEELDEELEAGVKFYGWEEEGRLLGVMGIQPRSDTALIRHAYVLTWHQRTGIGSRLLRHLIRMLGTEEVLVGTWAAATWAINFYRKHGFALTSREETVELLNKYWNISERQIETSVVLRLNY